MTKSKWRDLWESGKTSSEWMRMRAPDQRIRDVYEPKLRAAFIVSTIE